MFLLQYIEPVLSQCTFLAYICKVEEFNIIKDGVPLAMSFCCVLSYSFVPCYFGEWVVKTCDYFSECAYGCNWTEQNIKFMKALCLIIQRSQRDYVFQVIGLIPVNFESFRKLQQMSYTAFTVVQNFQ